MGLRRALYCRGVAFLVVLCFFFLALVAVTNAAEKVRRDPNDLIVALEATAQRFPLFLNDSMVREVVTTPLERNYSLVLLFISDDPKCAACGPFYKSFLTIKQAYEDATEAEQTKSLFFALLLEHSTPKTFKKFSISAVPSVVFVSKGHFSKADLGKNIFAPSRRDAANPAKFASWLTQVTGRKVSAPINWVDTLPPLVIVAVCLIFTIMKWSSIRPLLDMPMFWFMLCLWVYGFTMSGMHWNMLRGAPLVSATRAGIQLFLPGNRQTIAEGVIMALLFMGGGVTWILFNVQLPRVRDPGKRVMQFSILALSWTMILCWVVVIYTGFKNRGYRPLAYAIS